MKRTAFCLMCAGLAALGVAVSRGQEPPPPPSEGTVDVIRFVDSGTVAEDEIVVEGATREVKKRAEGGGDSKSELVEIEIGSDGVVQGGGQGGFRVQVENGDVVISNKDGKVIEKHQFGTAPGKRFAFVAGQEGPVIDQQTREQLEKVVAGLKDQAKQLEGEGKKEEAAAKIRSIEAIQHLLSGKGYGVTGRRTIHIAGTGPEAEELKKLHAERDKLAKALATKANVGDEEAAKIKQAVAEIEKQIAEKHKQLAGQGTAIHGYGAGQMHAQPLGMPGMRGMGGFGGQGMAPGGGGMVMRFGGDHKAQALGQQAEALSQAAARLKEAGLADQAKELAAQAEKLRDQAKKIEKEAMARLQAHGFTSGGTGGGGFVAFGGAPAGDLQRSIKELQEQVQQLRKEVAEVRELLQKK